MPDSLMSWGHSSMLSKVKKAFKKAPSSPSSKDKQSASPENSSRGPSSHSGSSNDHWSSRGQSAHSGARYTNGHADQVVRESSAFNEHLSSLGRTHPCQAYPPHSSRDTSSSNGHSSINQLFPSSPRATGFDAYNKSQNGSTTPVSPAPYRLSTKQTTDANAKAKQVLGVSDDDLRSSNWELPKVPNLSRGYDASSTNIDEFGSSSDSGESFTEPGIHSEMTPPYSKSESESIIPSSFEFYRPSKVVDDGVMPCLPEARITSENAAELDSRNPSFQFGQGNQPVMGSPRLRDEPHLDFHEAPETRRSTALYPTRSWPEQNGHISSGVISPRWNGTNGTSCGSSRTSREFYSVDNRLSPTHSEEGVVDLNGVNYRSSPYSSGSNPRRFHAVEYRVGEDLGSEFHESLYRSSNKVPAQIHSPRVNPKLCNGALSPQNQYSPRTAPAWVHNGCHSPEGRSWGSTNSSAKGGRQEGSWGSNGSASPQWVNNGHPSPDGSFRPDRNCMQGHPLPAPPPPQHQAYVQIPSTPGRGPTHLDSPRQAQRERSVQPVIPSRVTSPSSPYVPPRMQPASPLSPLVSPRPSPPLSPMRLPLIVPHSPRSPLPVPPQSFSRHPSPPRSPCRPPRIPTKWAKIKEIGTGSFGTVHEAINLDDGSFFAVKISRGETITPEIQKEIEVLSYLKHPNVVQYYGTGQEEGHLCIFLELMNTSLQSIIKHFQTFDETLISTYTRQILQGLEYLHKKNTIHRDIKCANILVDKGGQVKLADFGLAKEVGLNPATSCKGTPYFMAPEILKPDKTSQRGYGLPVDIWSLGCTVLEMADGKPPWSGTKGFSWFFTLFKGELPPIPPHLSPACVDFITKCLQFKPENRPTASELLRHAFVANAPTTAVAPSYMVDTLLPTAPVASPWPVPFHRNGPNLEVTQSRSSVGFPAQIVQEPQSPDSRPRLLRCPRMERTLSRSFSNPCMDTRELSETIHAPRTPPPANLPALYGRNDAW